MSHKVTWHPGFVYATSDNTRVLKTMARRCWSYNNTLVIRNFRSEIDHRKIYKEETTCSLFKKFIYFAPKTKVMVDLNNQIEFI